MDTSIDIEKAVLFSAKMAGKIVNTATANNWSTKNEMASRKKFQAEFLDFLIQDNPRQPSQETIETALSLEVDRLCAFLDCTRHISDTTQNELEIETLKKCKSLYNVAAVLKSSSEVLDQLLDVLSNPTPAIPFEVDPNTGLSGAGRKAHFSR